MYASPEELRKAQEAARDGKATKHQIEILKRDISVAGGDKSFQSLLDGASRRGGVAWPFRKKG